MLSFAMSVLSRIPSIIFSLLYGDAGRRLKKLKAPARCPAA
jgi:hypothetical protein